MFQKVEVTPIDVLTLPDHLPVPNENQSLFSNSTDAEYILRLVQAVIPNAVLSTGDPANKFLDSFSGERVMYMHGNTPRIYMIRGTYDFRITPGPNEFGGVQIETLKVEECVGTLISKFNANSVESINVRKVEDDTAELEWNTK
jgi:hypothetical protein